MDILHPYIKYALVHNEVSEQLMTSDISQIFLDHVQDNMEPTNLNNFGFSRRNRIGMGDLPPSDDTSDTASDSTPIAPQPNHSDEDSEDSSDNDDEWFSTLYYYFELDDLPYRIGAPT